MSDLAEPHHVVLSQTVRIARVVEVVEVTREADVRRAEATVQRVRRPADEFRAETPAGFEHWKIKELDAGDIGRIFGRGRTTHR